MSRDPAATTSSFTIGQERSHALKQFMTEVESILEAGFQEYGWTAEAIYSALGPPACGYAVAEKGLRYGKKGNPKDLVKAATYAFLGWRQSVTNR